MNTEKNTTAEGPTGAAAPVTLQYTVKHDLSDMVTISEALRAAGIIVVPSVHDSWRADAQAWRAPEDSGVAIKIRGYGDRPFLVGRPDDHGTVQGYIDELLTVLSRAGKPVPRPVRVLYCTGGYPDEVVARQMRLYGLDVATDPKAMPDPEVTVTYRDDRMRVQIGETEHVHDPRGYFRADSLYARSLADLIHGQVQR